MRIHCLQHTESKARTYLPAWAARHGHAWQCTIVPRAHRLPALSDLDCLVVMGGPMRVSDDTRHAWLAEEKRFLEQVIDAGRPLLGICLGAQLLAEVLGARVYPGRHKEIGWFPVDTTSDSRESWVGDVLPPSFETFLWHGDTFEIPAGATHIARSAAFENQGFIWNRTLALQFHLEVSPDWVAMLAERDGHELQAADYVQPAEAILGRPGDLYRHNNSLMQRLLNTWLEGL